MKTWGKMNDAEKGELLLAWYNDDVIEYFGYVDSKWFECVDGPYWLFNVAYRVKPKETTYTGECWAYHYDNMEPTFAHFNVSDICTHGTYTATHVNGKPTRIVWEVDQ